MNQIKNRHIVIPIFVPHKGCPFDCIYCSQKKISGQTEDMTIEKMTEIIERHLETASSDSFVEIGFYGGSFTGIDKDEQIEFLMAANKYISANKVSSIRLSTRPDYIDEEILDYLKKYNVRTIELGVQSMDDSILKTSCRGHNTEDVIKASVLIKESDFNLGIQTMIGLPGDSREKDMETAEKVIELKPDIVRIYPVLVIKDTYLETMYNDGRYKPINLDEAVEICAELLDLYEKNDINVIRIGLQPTDNINENMDVVAGPFHPAFRQLVESRRILKQLIKQIEEKKLYRYKDILIAVPEKSISDVIGQKRANIDFLKRKFGFNTVKILEQKRNDICIMN